MNGITILRRTARFSVFATVCSLAIPLGLLPIAGCGDSAKDGATVKADERPQEGIDTMKNFMDKQKGAAKK